MSTGSSSFYLTDFPNVCAYCSKSFRQRIELLDHKWKDHQDDIRRVKRKSESNQDLKESSQLDTLKDQHNAEIVGKKAKESTSASNFPAYSQMEDKVVDITDEQEETVIANDQKITEIPVEQEVTEISDEQEVIGVSVEQEVTEVLVEKEVAEISNEQEVTEIADQQKVTEMPDEQEVTEIAVEDEDEEEKKYKNYTGGNDVMDVTDIINSSSNQEIAVQQGEIFKTSNCDSDFLTLKNLNINNSECDDEIQSSYIFAHEKDNTITSPKVGRNRRKSSLKKRLFEYDDDEGQVISPTNKRDRPSSIQIVNVETLANFRKESVQLESSQQEEGYNQRKSRHQEQLFEDKVQEVNPTKKRPELTYNCLIALAIKNSPTKTIIFRQIFEFVAKVFPYFEHAGKNNWKNIISIALFKSTLFKKIQLASKGRGHSRFSYGLNSDPASQLELEALFRNECLNNKADIQSCMRRPEDFSSLLSGDLRMPAEEEEEDDNEPLSKKPKVTTFKDTGFSAASLETSASQSPTINYLDDNNVEQVEDKEKNQAREGRRKKPMKTGEKLGESVPAQLEASFKRPKLSFNCLIALAIKNSPTQAVSSHEILEFVSKVFPYYQNTVNQNWKINLRGTIGRSPLFKKINDISSVRKKRQLFYGFDLKAESKLRIDKLIQEECKNKEADIKRCMRRPGDFSSLVSGDLRVLPEEDEGDDKDKEGNEKEVEVATFQDLGFVSAPIESAESQSAIIIILDENAHQVGINDDDDEDKPGIKEKNETSKNGRKKPVRNVEKEQESNQGQLQSSYQPKLTFGCLITLAIKNSPTHTVTYDGILKFLAQVFPFFEYAANKDWKNNISATLGRSILFTKISNSNNSGQNKRRVFYGFDSEPESKLRIDKLIQEECLSNEASIKSCMRRPDDFAALVCGFLRVLAEEDGGDGRDMEENE